MDIHLSIIFDFENFGSFAGHRECICLVLRP